MVHEHGWQVLRHFAAARIPGQLPLLIARHLKQPSHPGKATVLASNSRLEAPPVQPSPPSRLPLLPPPFRLTAAGSGGGTEKCRAFRHKPPKTSAAEVSVCDAPVFISAYRIGYHLAPSPCCPAQEAALCERRLDGEPLCEVGGTPALVHVPPDLAGSFLHLLA